MEIRHLIQNRFLERGLKLYAKNGELVPSDLVVEEFQGIRNYLLSVCGGPDDILAIKATKDYRYLLTMLASLEIGIPYIPMMVDYPMDRVGQIQIDSNFKLLVTDELLEEMVKFQGSGSELSEVSIDKTAYIIFTSGSTGKPKGVMIPRKALSNFFSWVASEFTHVNSDDHLIQLTEFTFDISLLDVGLFLQKNAHVHFSNFNHDLFRMAYEIETNKISVLNTVPNNLSMLLSDVMKDRVDLSNLKTLMIAGARFSYGLYQKCMERLGTEIHLYNLYGPTESTVYSHGKKLTFDKAKDCSDLNVSIGKTLPNVTARIDVEKSELLLGGVQLLQRYMNAPEITAAAFVEVEGERYYRSGDIAFCDEKGDYFITGRLDDTIKCRGFRINLLDIDSYIQRLPYVEDVATIAIPHEIAENQTVSFMRLKTPKTVKEIKADLLEFLLDYQIPEKIHFVDSFPTNSSGKIDRKLLRSNLLEKK